MNTMIHTDAPPLRRDALGALRIGQSRVLLELVIRAFQGGATPEMIVQRYPTATLADIYAVIAYYLRHPQDIEGYLAAREAAAQQIREHIQHEQGDLSEIRRRLRAQKSKYGPACCISFATRI